METVVMVFAGEYDLTSKEQLRTTLARLSTMPRVVLDFSDVTYLDSTVITELIRMRKLRAASGFERETIVFQHPPLKRLFDILDMGKVFRLVGTLDDAVEKNGAPVTVQYAFTNGPTRYEALEAAG
jgi:anti-anti-sigma factor